ncbi:MAG: flippase activity-associated protein Agl23 [Thermoanaerobaculia bacterium]
MSETAQEPATQPEPAAGAPERRPIDRRLVAALTLAAAVALATRLVGLGDRALHHDESIHAYMSYTLSKDGNWRYDPAYHGPFLYYANALVYKIAGASNTSARVLPALFGLILIGFAWPLARWFGKTAAAFYAVLILLSPHMAYFSRFIREDLYSLVFTLATILFFRMYLETDRPRWLTLSAAAFALAGVTKENAYMTGVLFVVFGIWAFLDRVARSASRSRAAKEAAAGAVSWIRERLFLLGSAAVVFLFLWALLYTAFGRYPADWLAIPKAVKYWMGQHAIARIAGPWWYYFPQLLQYDTAILFLAPFAFSARQWKSDPLLRFAGLLMPLLFLLAAGEVSGIFHPLSPSRWIVLGCLLCLIAAYGPRQAEPAQVPAFQRFWAFWAIASFLIYAWAREKVPWLTVHPLLPLAVLASFGAARLWSRRTEPRPLLALAAGAVLLAVNAHGLYRACFRYGAHDLEREPNHAEMMAYVQTSEDFVRALGALDKARGRVPGGDALITVAGEASWPLTWYLRDTPTKWSSRVEDAATPILVVDWDPEGAIEKQLRERYDARRVPIRAWWFPGVVGGSGPKALARPTLSDVLRLWLFHETWSPIGSQDATFLVRKDLAGTGPLTPLTVHIQDTTSRDYAAPADSIPTLRSFGSTGPDAGRFGEPRGLAADASGNLYVADTKNHRIQVFDPAGRPLRAFGAKGSGDGQLNEPCGVAIDPQGDIWVADTWNGRIARFSADGAWRGAITDLEKPLFGPRAVAVSRGVLYVADTGNKRIVRFDRDGRKLSDWGGGGVGPGQFVEPVGLAADAAGNIYVNDTGNHRVQIFDPEGKFVRQFPIFGWKDFYTEPHIALGPSGSVFVTDSSQGRVCVYDAQGTLKRTWKPNQTFKAPTGIAIDPFGTLTVSDRGTDRLFSWSLSSVIR